MIDLKSLEALLKLCRKHGVLTIDLGSELKFSLSDLPPVVNVGKKAAAITEPFEKDAFDFEELDEEQKLFWSSLPGSGTKPPEEGN